MAKDEVSNRLEAYQVGRPPIDWPRMVRGAVMLGTIQIACILIRYFDIDIVSQPSSTKGIWVLSIFPVPLLCVAIVIDLLRNKLSKVN